ncbi:hypothetical protein BDM02DRAFT_3109440 [Thelephora ganbajun]|uniref:Uncharacterized protein n=1 Tax=Thelephora ganbajun TaxID=370292 RepID=A0ACB6ZSA6_THEGA|nr:hypothetical protein BDM02DRAFT_3109440 [Thelephora ganbajun]
MVANRPTDHHRYQVLILAPLALLDQWQLEIELKTNCGLKCYVHHGQTRAKKVSDLEGYDVIITTHATLVSEWHNANFEEIWAKKKTNAYRRKSRSAGFIVDDEDGDAALKKAIKKKKNKSTGVLYEIQWYRVIVDEAHQIRNKMTRVSNAVVDLDATYRWCLTGTPIINTLSDAYGLIRFLQMRPWNDWSEFNEVIGRHEKKRPKLATDRLQSIFKTILLRRNKDTVLDGKKLITLPPKTVELVKLEFCLEEREIYKTIESKSQQIFNRFLRAGTVLKHYHYVLVLLLRLRQICNHPALISEREEDLEAAGRTRAEAEVERAIKSFGAGFVAKVKAKIRDLETERMEVELTQSGGDGQGGQIEECPICFDVLSDGVVTGCCHIFCRECITGILNNPPTNNTQNMNEDERPCPSCRQPISSSRLFTLEAFNAPKQSASLKKGKLRASARPFEFATGSMDVDESESYDDFIVPDDDEDHKPRRGKKYAKRNVVLSDDEYDDVIIPAAKPEAKPKASVGEMNEYEISTKMQRMMDELIALKKSNPDQKTVVISQWTGYLNMVSRYLTNEGFAHVKYQGSMSRDERGRVVRAFMAKDNATVMLMSLKCGGVGLNLTRANRVISLDMAWSRAIDDQAFDRVHRLGQDREVFVKRLVIANTVEDRILHMQETKKYLADGSLGEGSGKKMGRMSVKQLANLFGLDHHGNLL